MSRCILLGFSILLFLVSHAATAQDNNSNQAPPQMESDSDSTSPLAEQEPDKVVNPLRESPALAVAGAKKVFPTFVVEQAFEVVSDTQTTYILAGKSHDSDCVVKLNANGQAFELAFGEIGSILLKSELKPEDIPENVKSGATKLVKDIVLESAFKMTWGDQVTYLLSGTKADKTIQIKSDVGGRPYSLKRQTKTNSDD